MSFDDLAKLRKHLGEHPEGGEKEMQLERVMAKRAMSYYLNKYNDGTGKINTKKIDDNTLLNLHSWLQVINPEKAQQIQQIIDKRKMHSAFDSMSDSDEEMAAAYRALKGLRQADAEVPA